ncbi:MAG: hypothetical protein QOE90_2588 [Thermoplasmata archaeon]|jgi:hypothetical protein|nr:hypothetical protein [Thermoplasmata archaeon]
MAASHLLAGSILGLACAALLAWGGVRTWRRAIATGSPPLRAFAVFWLGAAGYVGADALWGLAWTSRFDELPFALAILQVKLASVCASFAGLVVYLLVIFSGSRRLRLPVAGAYLALFLALEAYYAWRAPFGVHVGFSSLGLDYLRPQPAPVWDALLLLLFGPPLVATVAYASLLRVTPGRAARRRVVLTSAALLLFFAPDLVGWLVGDLWWWDMAERALAFAAGLGILAATGTAPMRSPRRPTDVAFTARARELI